MPQHQQAIKLPSAAAKALECIPLVGDVVGIGFSAYELYKLYTSSDKIYDLQRKRKQAIANLVLGAGTFVLKLLLILGVGALASAAAIFAAPVAIAAVVAVMSAVKLWSAWKEYRYCSRPEYREALTNELMEISKKKFFVDYYRLRLNKSGNKIALDEASVREAAEIGWEEDAHIDMEGYPAGKHYAYAQNSIKIQREVMKLRREAFIQTAVAVAGAVAGVFFLGALLASGVGAVALLGLAMGLTILAVGYVGIKWGYEKAKKAPPISDLDGVKKAAELAAEKSDHLLKKQLEEVSKNESGAAQKTEKPAEVIEVVVEAVKKDFTPKKGVANPLTVAGSSCRFQYSADQASPTDTPVAAAAAA